MRVVVLVLVRVEVTVIGLMLKVTTFSSPLVEDEEVAGATLGDDRSSTSRGTTMVDVTTALTVVVLHEVFAGSVMVLE